METLTELKAKREALGKQIAEMEAKEWPKEGETYFYFDGISVCGEVWNTRTIHKSRKEGIGISKTFKEEQYWANYFKLLREIDAFCEERNPQGWDWRDENNDTWGIDYSCSDKKIFLEFYQDLSPMYGKLKEKRHAKELLEKFGDRIMEVINFKK